MSRLIIVTLTDAERAALEKCFRHGASHAFRTRCRMILLKANRLPSSQIAPQVGYCLMSVNGWVKRYQQKGIAGLKTKPGRGRKTILDNQADLQQMHAAMQYLRQNISLAKSELETSLGKEFSAKTLKRFLIGTMTRNSVADTNA